jgi:hypothetical protein
MLPLSVCLASAKLIAADATGATLSRALVAVTGSSYRLKFEQTALGCALTQTERYADSSTSFPY